MHVLFLEVDHDRAWAIASMGPGFLASFLRANGHQATFKRVTLDTSVDDVVKLIAELKPGLLALSLTTRQWLRARALVGDLRARGVDLPVVAGGLHPTFAPEEVLASPGFDYVCVGEGEEPLLDLAAALGAGRAIGAGTIDNIQVRGGPPAVKRRPYEPIDALPFLARDMLDEHHGCYHLSTQRGCPFPCTYCAARMFDELYKDVGYGRRRSHANVLAEVEALTKIGLAYIIFLDDTFTIHHPWVKEFCKVYGERYRIPFSLHARVETVNQDLLAKLAAAGCKHITYGVESGSLRVRRDIMKRPVTNDRFKEVFRWSKDLGILSTANYMLGLPGETPDDIEQTLALHEELDPDDFGYFVFYPYPGTEMFRTCRDAGYLPSNYLELPANHRRSILNLPDLTQDDIERYYDRFTQARIRAYSKRYRARGMPEAQVDEAVRSLVASADCG